jgi:arsenate reductase (glutaredoxin)
MLRIYHNPKCAKSREGLKYLLDKGYEFETILYLDKTIADEELKTLLMKLNLKPVQVIRMQEEQYRKELKGRKFTDEEWIKIITNNPKLLQRPIVEGKYKAVIAIPPDKIEELNK